MTPKMRRERIHPVVTPVFKLLPGEKVLLIVGMPGPDMEPATVVSDDGKDLVVRYQVYEQGRFYEEVKPRTAVLWRRGSDTAHRYAAWLEIQKEKPK